MWLNTQMVFKGRIPLLCLAHRRWRINSMPTQNICEYIHFCCWSTKLICIEGMILRFECGTTRAVFLSDAVACSEMGWILSPVVPTLTKKWNDALFLIFKLFESWVISWWIKNVPLTTYIVPGEVALPMIWSGSSRYHNRPYSQLIPAKPATFHPTLNF